MRAVCGGVRWHMMRQAKREMVLCTDCVSALLWLPATVSVTTNTMSSPYFTGTLVEAVVEMFSCSGEYIGLG
ncbi:hypothetical protein EYF80_063082 [Liparis tanakae]|uniref:Uncharacterized protein n=1 Tax=Liparis tanakae TaxID=230148 RepID=A0A4Z2EDF7_9TELE|nr:hypothetical protein EYF80_063082 [Liparis tanakae]